MATLRDVMGLVDEQGSVTASQIGQHFGIDPEQARRVLISLLDKGLLVWCPGLPKQAVFFARPPENGRAYGLLLRHKAGVSSGVDFKERWYRPYLDKLRSHFEVNPDSGVTVFDVMGKYDVSRKIAMTALRMLVDTGELIQRRASSGGVYGQPPYIFGKTEKALLEREEGYIEEKVEKSKKKRKSSGGLIDESHPGYHPVTRDREGKVKIDFPREEP